MYSGPSKLTSLFGKSKKGDGEKDKDKDDGEEKGPKIVKTTTKQLMVKDSEGVTENIEEKIEDFASGQVSLSTHVNKVRQVLTLSPLTNTLSLIKVTSTGFYCCIVCIGRETLKPSSLRL